MRYLFFDIECCDGNNICSFGYTICDTDFNILEKEDIVINPEAEFKLSRSGFDPRIELAYSEKVFKNSPDFPSVYEKIKELLSNGDQIICGHAVSNDAKFLVTACKRYKLPQFSYYFMDSQKMVSILGARTSLSLEKIADKFKVEMGILHRSDEDACLTMLVVKKICEILKMNLKEIIEIVPMIVSSTQDGMIKNSNASSYKVFKGKVKNLVKGDGKLNGEKIAFSEVLEKNDTIKVWSLVNEIERLGGEYTNMVQDATMFVRAETDCKRLKAAGMYMVKVLNIYDFAKFIDMDFSSFYFEKPIRKTSFKKGGASVGDMLKGKLNFKELNEMIEKDEDIK